MKGSRLFYHIVWLCCQTFAEWFQVDFSDMSLSSLPPQRGHCGSVPHPLDLSFLSVGVLPHIPRRNLALPVRNQPMPSMNKHKMIITNAAETVTMILDIIQKPLTIIIVQMLFWCLIRRFFPLVFLCTNIFRQVDPDRGTPAYMSIFLSYSQIVEGEWRFFIFAADTNIF